MKKTYKPSIFKLKKMYGFRTRLKIKVKLLNKRLLKKKKLINYS